MSEIDGFEEFPDLSAPFRTKRQTPNMLKAYQRSMKKARKSNGINKSNYDGSKITLPELKSTNEHN